MFGKWLSGRPKSGRSQGCRPDPALTTTLNVGFNVMANADLIAPVAMRNTCANTVSHLSHPLRMIMELEAAIGLERQLLRCDGCAAETDHQIRKAESQWRQVDAIAALLQRDSAPGSVAHRCAQIVRSVVLCRDTVIAPRVLSRAICDVWVLGAQSSAPMTAAALHKAVGLLSQMRRFEQSEIPPTDTGACPDGTDLGLEI
jgi:hypothetical protein